MSSHVHIHKLKSSISTDLRGPLHPAQILKPSHSDSRGEPPSHCLFGSKVAHLPCSVPSSLASAFTPLLFSTWVPTLGLMGLGSRPFSCPNTHCPQADSSTPAGSALTLTSTTRLPAPAQASGPGVQLPPRHLLLDALQGPPGHLTRTDSNPLRQHLLL